MRLKRFDRLIHHRYQSNRLKSWFKKKLLVNGTQKCATQQKLNRITNAGYIIIFKFSNCLIFKFVLMSVLIFIDHTDGHIKKASLEALSYGAKIAEQTGDVA